MNELAELLKIAKNAVSVGCSLLRTADPGTVGTKDDRDFVTDLDLRIQSTIKEHLSRTTPDISFLGEEQSEHRILDGHQWILDPIDGTSNFIHGLPMCAVSLALAHDGIPIVGVIGAPFLNLEYIASTGQGAFVNGNRIKVSCTQSLGNSLVSIGDYATGTGASTKNQRRFAVTVALAENVERIRMLGSAALDLAWVAEGRIDACVLLSNKPWDTAAGVLIARESGAVVTDSDGRHHSLTSAHTIAATPAISGPLLNLLASCG
jgi:myo-inositol-1(or 4)-monophosphatase